MKHRILAAAFAAAALLGATPARAQTAPADSAVVGPRTQAISILPLHFLFGFYAGDYERKLSPTTTIGFGASYFSFGGWGDDYDDEPVYVDGEPYFDDSEDGDFRYTSAEVKLRYYPSGDAMDGISFGITAGPTFVSGDSSLGGDDENFSALGLGFEFARSSTLGVDRRFYYGAGVGAKRLFPIGGDTDNDAALVLPTLRLSVGLLF